jgi:hypothetical protein
MASKKFKPFTLLLFASLLCWAPDASLADENEMGQARYKWAFTLYGGAFAQDTIGDIFSFQPDFREKSYIAVAALSRELWRYKDWIGLETEGQVGKHFGEMHHWEFNLLLDLRWHYFPWDKYVETSFAVGDGLSYATEVPELELEDDEEAQRLLNYLMFELTFGLPKYPRWDFVVRAHHRSGVFGLFDGVRGGGNFVCGGIKYKF